MTISFIAITTPAAGVWKDAAMAATHDAAQTSGRALAIGSSIWNIYLE